MRRRIPESCKKTRITICINPELADSLKMLSRDEVSLSSYLEEALYEWLFNDLWLRIDDNAYKITEDLGGFVFVDVNGDRYNDLCFSSISKALKWFYDRKQKKLF